MIDLREYERLALETGAFLDIELEILKETLKIWDENPGKTHTLVELRDGKILAGFCLYHRAANTDFSVDVHSFIVDRDYRSKGVGSRLLIMVEEELLNRMGSCLLRVEISQTKERIVEPDFFPSQGFETIGHIPDFYEQGNDYYIYVKHIHPHIAEETAQADMVAAPDANEAVPTDQTGKTG